MIEDDDISANISVKTQGITADDIPFHKLEENLVGTPEFGKERMRLFR